MPVCMQDIFVFPLVKHRSDELVREVYSINIGLSLKQLIRHAQE